MRYSSLPSWLRQYVANWAASWVYCSAVMLPPQPQFSLPMPQKGTFHGSDRPCSRRSRDIGASPDRVRYSIQSLISATVPDPTLPDT